MTKLASHPSTHLIVAALYCFGDSSINTRSEQASSSVNHTPKKSAKQIECLTLELSEKVIVFLLCVHDNNDKSKDEWANKEEEEEEISIKLLFFFPLRLLFFFFWSCHLMIDDCRCT